MSKKKADPEILKDVEVFIDRNLKNLEYSEIVEISKELNKICAAKSSNDNTKYTSLVNNLKNSSLKEYINSKSEIHLDLLKKNIQKLQSKLNNQSKENTIKINIEKYNINNQEPKENSKSNFNVLVLFSYRYVNILYYIILNKDEKTIFLIKNKLNISPLNFDEIDYLIYDEEYQENDLNEHLFDIKLINYFNNNSFKNVGNINNDEFVKQELKLDEFYSDLEKKINEKYPNYTFQSINEDENQLNNFDYLKNYLKQIKTDKTKIKEKQELFMITNRDDVLKSIINK